MTGQFDRADNFCGARIDNAETAVAIPDVNALTNAVVANVIRVIFEIGALKQRKRFAVIEVANPSFVIRNKRDASCEM